WVVLGLLGVLDAETGRPLQPFLLPFELLDDVISDRYDHVVVRDRGQRDLGHFLLDEEVDGHVFAGDDRDHGDQHGEDAGAGPLLRKRTESDGQPDEAANSPGDPAALAVGPNYDPRPDRGPDRAAEQAEY